MSRICRNFEITGLIYSNSERSIQFLKQNVFLTSPGGFSNLIHWNNQNSNQKINGVQKFTGKRSNRKVRKYFSYLLQGNRQKETDKETEKCIYSFMRFSYLETTSNYFRGLTGLQILLRKVIIVHQGHIHDTLYVQLSQCPMTEGMYRLIIMRSL